MPYLKDEQEFSPGLAEFTEKAHEYIESLHDFEAKRFGLRYVVYLQAKAKKIPHSEPGAEPGLSAPDRSLIRIYVRKLYDEYYKKKRRKSV